MAKNKKYSHRDCMFQDLTKEPAKDFDGSEIVGSCFYQREPQTDVFPPAMTGVEFIACNLDNCVVPAGNTVTEGTHKQFKEQNDMEKWIVNASNEPIEPLRTAEYDKFGLSKDPNDIPLTPKTESILEEKRKEADLAAK